MKEVEKYWYDPYGGYIIPGWQREERVNGTCPLSSPINIQRALEYERLSAHEIFDRLRSALHHTVDIIGKDKFQEIMQGLRPCKHESI